VVLRIGESDGLDIKETFRSKLVLKSPAMVNRWLKAILPVFEHHRRRCIFRTWTVGAHEVGDLIWREATLEKTVAGLSSPALVLSMKYGESDFFRYLSLNRYHAVTSPDFDHRMLAGTTGPITPETRKQVAIRDFIEHIVRVLQRTPTGEHWAPVSVGFSDDDPANVKAVGDFIREELARRFPNIKFVLYDTSDPSLEKGRKITIAGQMDLGLKP